VNTNINAAIIRLIFKSFVFIVWPPLLEFVCLDDWQAKRVYKRFSRTLHEKAQFIDL